jgi:hypothetical protein
MPITEHEERISNAGFKRGLEAGAAKSSKEQSSSTPSPSAPNLDDNQSVTFELLLILGMIVLLMSPVGDWLGSIVREISVKHDMNLTFNPLDNKTTITPGTGITAGPMQPGGSNQLVGHYTVNLAGGGQMTVNASDPQAAVANVKAEGGTPA